jgi:phosphopantothenoylcysteine decarboxylase/phosphopantothenate--cysteine ligase
MEENARKKLKEKGLDFVVANTPAGLDSDTNQVTILSRDGQADRLEALPKEEVADRILDRALK